MGGTLCDEFGTSIVTKTYTLVEACSEVLTCIVEVIHLNLTSENTLDLVFNGGEIGAWFGNQQ